MTSRQTTDLAPARLDRLLSYLDQDPGNLSLLASAVEAAFEAGELDHMHRLLDRYGEAAPLPTALVNLSGLLAIAERRFKDAEDVFTTLAGAYPGDAGLAFNLAWTKAQQQDYAGALDLIDDGVLEATSAAASFKIQMLHHLGALDEALEQGGDLARRFPQNAPLMAALATVAIDADAPDQAQAYAARAGEEPDGLAALGVIALNADQAGPAGVLFDRALRAAPDNPRALLGKGLVLLLAGQAQEATGLIDRCAEIFDHHLGSWIAAGWARFIAGDSAGARQRFERALALDDRFAEAQGAIAVVDIAEGRLQDGRRRAEVALRLDRNCLAGTLARVLLLTGEGKVETAERIRSIALNRPLNDQGRTIASAMAGFGFAASRRADRSDA